LLKAFIKAGVQSDTNSTASSVMGTPQGGIATPPAMLQNG